jgi:putative heme-binding domain-containing protein
LTHIGAKPEYLNDIAHYIVESIVDPSAKMDAKYVTTNVKTRDGLLYSGFVASETTDVLTLKIAINGGKEPPQDIAIPKSNILKKAVTKVSSMPEGLAGTMSPGEFVDLVEYLRGLK